MCVLSIKVPIRKKSGNLSYAPRIYRERKIVSFVEFERLTIEVFGSAIFLSYSIFQRVRLLLEKL